MASLIELCSHWANLKGPQVQRRAWNVWYPFLPSIKNLTPGIKRVNTFECLAYLLCDYGCEGDEVRNDGHKINHVHDILTVSTTIKQPSYAQLRKEIPQRQFCVLYWEEIITKISPLCSCISADFVIIPPRNHSTELEDHLKANLRTRLKDKIVIHTRTLSQ